MLWSSQKMGISRSYVYMHLHLLVLFTFILSAGSETQNFSFPQFSANDQTILTFRDAQYNPGSHSFVLNSKSPALANGTCEILLYDGKTDLKIQASVAGKVGSFSTSFTFKITTPSQQTIWYVNGSANKVESRLALVIERSFLHQNGSTLVTLQNLGSGGYGIVYKGYLEGYDNPFVAVKRINYDSKHAERTFLAEISSLSQIRHRNVVQLHGWCLEKGQLLLVYDYIFNGRLNEWLHESGNSHKRKGVLSLKQRHHILIGVAATLEYLHNDCLQCVLHRDIKSSNVMLDAAFEAHLGDFGPTRSMDHYNLDKTTLATGTFGYMALEMPYTGKATKEYDVYRFGILVLEVVCRRRPLDLIATKPEDVVLLYSIWRPHEAGALLSVTNPRMPQIYQHSSLKPGEGEFDFDIQKMMIKNLLHLGLLCCLPNPKACPTMEQVIQILQQIGNIDNVDYRITNSYMPPLPDTKPP